MSKDNFNQGPHGLYEVDPEAKKRLRILIIFLVIGFMAWFLVVVSESKDTKSGWMYETFMAPTPEPVKMPLTEGQIVWILQETKIFAVVDSLRGLVDSLGNVLVRQDSVHRGHLKKDKEAAIKLHTQIEQLSIRIAKKDADLKQSARLLRITETARDKALKDYVIVLGAMKAAGGK